MSAASFVLAQAWRETRAAPRRLLLLLAAISVGVAALVAIESFTDNLQRSVSAQARALLGADLSVGSRRPLPDSATAAIAAIPGERAATVAFSGMAYVPRTSGSRLVQVTAVEGAWPFYGEIRTAPAQAWKELAGGAHVVVEPSLLTALDAHVGDTLSLGEVRFLITGTVVSAPGDVGVRAAFGARVYIPAAQLAATKLLGIGSRAEYTTFLKLPAGTDAQATAKALRAALANRQFRVRTVADRETNLNQALERLGNYLGLVALIALLLGGLGVASAVVAHLRRKRETIAVLRCLGASAGQVFAIYLLQVTGMALAGSLVGVALGVGVQQLLPIVLRDFLPVDVAATPSLRAVALGLGAGTWAAIAFALPPLLSVRLVAPLAALRRDFLEQPLPRDPLLPAAYLVLAASLAGLAVLEVGALRPGLVFSAGIGTALAVLWGAAALLIRLLRRRVPASLPYTWRQGLANLHRPQNQTVVVVLALGFGGFLMATLVVVQTVLLSQLQLGGGTVRPNMVLIDLQPDQAEKAKALLAAEGVSMGSATPIVPMRLSAVQGNTVAQLAGRDSSAPGDGPDGGGGSSWALKREYRSTYRDTLVSSEKLVAGRWWSGPHPAGATTPVEISIEQDVAKEIGAALGDEVAWDVQGVQLKTKITSVRTVEWARFEPNFFVVFQPGALEAAPQSLVAVARARDDAQRGRAQRRLAEALPNVTTIDLAQIQQSVEALVDKIVLAIRFMAAFSLVAGAVVLVGAIATTRDQRLREGALLRTLGATQGQVLRVLAAEYLALGGLAAVAAVGLALAAGWALARFTFESPFVVPAGALALLAAIVSLGTVAVGLLNSLDAVRRTPLEVLRTE